MVDHDEVATLAEGEKHRRNLVIASGLVCVLVFTGVDITSVSVLGINLSGTEGWRVHSVLLIWVGYAWLRFYHTRKGRALSHLADDSYSYLTFYLNGRLKPSLNKLVKKQAPSEPGFAFLRMGDFLEVDADKEPTWGEIHLRVAVTYKQADVEYFKDKAIHVLIGKWLTRRIWLNAFFRSLLAKPAFLEHLFPHLLATLAVISAFISWDLVWLRTALVAIFEMIAGGLNS